VFVAGYETLHKFIVSRLAERTDIWIAQALSAPNFAKGTVYRMKPDVTIVDLDPIWNPAGLPLARSVSEACPDAHVILVAPDGYPQGPMVATVNSHWPWCHCDSCECPNQVDPAQLGTLCQNCSRGVHHAERDQKDA
jgi:hypothetical protein